MPKHHPRVAACGSIDELNAVLGRGMSDLADPLVRKRLERVQHELFDLGAELATPPADQGRRKPDTRTLPEASVGDMEAWIDTAAGELPPLRQFILPGGSRGSAALHVARAVCRRAERAVTRLSDAEPVDDAIIRYLNRLSDLLFVFARLENHREGVADVVWQSGADRP